jgi:hypothetical protein
MAAYHRKLDLNITQRTQDTKFINSPTVAVWRVLRKLKSIQTIHSLYENVYT